ncbi:MAG: UPF0149 family protein, partial [Gammaproteobacteria bacterium]|nr:UPF0149 family protein [Gammaproteobacteria bacterium]
KVYITVDEWCEGYARGMDLAPSAWETEEKEIAELLAPILAFTEKTKWRGHDLDELETEKLQEAITPNVRKIHAYWLARREEEPPTNQAPYKRETKVGRNEPCPCGSGKKFKQCCLH